LKSATETIKQVSLFDFSLLAATVSTDILAADAAYPGTIRMKIWRVIVLCCAVCASSAAEAQDKVRLQQKKVVVGKHPDEDRDFRDFQRSVSYPLLSGIADKALLKRLQSAVMPRVENKDAVAEMKQERWLQEVTYKVNCNQHSLLHLTYQFSGLGAYPDEFYRYIAIDLRTGQRVTIKDLFTASALPQLIAKANRMMQAVIRQTIQTVDKEEQADIKQRLSSVKFDASNLTDFTVTPKGVTFHLDFGFPHVIKALQPRGEYFFSFAALKPYIRRDGLLNAFLK
jgi:hypothetical protein